MKASEIHIGARDGGKPEWVRALAGRPPRPSKPRAACETFKWVVEPEGGWLQGDIYTDGSVLDGPTEELSRCGWAFVILDDQFNVTAAAHGVHPPWITDIGGGEAWALLQAAKRALPGMCRFKVDSLSTVQAVHAGMPVATSAKKIYARVYTLLFAALDDTPAEATIWMPAHKKEHHVGKILCGNGEALTTKDLKANEWADKLAKRAVEAHRVPSLVVKKWKDAMADARRRAMWIARATAAMNNSEQFPFKDSEAARWRSEAAAAERRKAKRLRGGGQGDNTRKKPPRIRFERPVALGGHVLEQTCPGSRMGWRCSVCKCTSASRAKLAEKRCSGSAVVRWAEKSAALFELGTEIGPGHLKLLSSNVLWCGTCGAYADTKARGMATPCKGAPKRGKHYGGAWGQLQKLLRGRHPRTGVALQSPTLEDGTPWQPTGVYARRDGHDETFREDFFGGLVSDGFVPYIPAPPPPPPRPREGKTAKEKMAERLLRVRAKEAASVVVAAVQGGTRRFRCSSKRPAAHLFLASRLR